MKELFKYAHKAISEYPELKEQIMDLVNLYLDDIDEGGSPLQLIELCKNSIKRLIEKQ